jgi:hypothetical protein
MSNTEERKINRFLCVSDAGKVQSDAVTPLANSDLDIRDKCEVTMTEVIERQITRDCRDEYPMASKIKTRLLRVGLNYAETTPHIMFRWLAIFLGGSSSPSGTPANEVQRLTRVGAASTGAFKLRMVLEGRTVTTKAIDWNATTTDIVNALTAARMLYIQPGDVTASGGTKQVEDLTVAGTCNASGNLPVTVRAAESPALAAGKVINVPILDLDTAAIVAGKIRVALAADTDVSAFFTISGGTTHVIGTAINAAANDATMAISYTAVLGMTAATSADSTAGVAPTLWGATGITLSFAERLRRANLPLLEIVDDTVDGGGLAITQITAGDQNFHEATISTTRAKLRTSFALGWEDVEDRVEKYVGFAVESWNPTVSRDGQVGLQVSLIGPWEPDSIEEDFTIPDCVNIDPLLAEDCRLLVDNNWETTDVNSETITLNDNIPLDKLSAFAFDGIDLQDVERGNQPTHSIAMGIFGTEVDAVYQLGYLERTQSNVPVVSHFGMPGNRCTVLMPSTHIQFQGNRWAFAGGREVSVVQLDGVPMRNDADLPVSAEAYLDQSSAFLATS